MVPWLIFASSTPGVPPPPPPRDLFGRDELIEKIVGLAGNSTPFALIGAGGIGKTSAALTALHDDRIKQRFGSDRWFIRCDQFPTSLTHFLRRLSKVIGAGVENPEDLTLLQPLLSSKEMFIILDNAESILDPRGTDAQEIYAMVEELSHYDNVCLCITSRISTIPPACEAIEIPTLSVAAARDTFYRIYKHSERPDLVDSILERLDFHPLSITLLATVAHHNKWDTGRLVREWERRRTEVLRTPHNKSLAATIELSLASPMFQELGPDARGLLGVVAFFPRGVDENNLEWLFPTVFNATNIFDNFCILSLTYRTNGFVTMLAPLRDHLCPKDPKSSPLLCAAKDRYFGRLSVGVYPGKVGYEGAQWIKSEDVNIEHLLDVFTNVDANSNGVWDTCSYFMEHIHWHKRRPVLLGPKIEALPDTHPSKPRCLFWFSQLLALVGNYTERKRLLIHALKLWRAQGDGYEVARTLGYLSDTNRLLELHKEGLQQARESLEIHERLRDEVRQAQSLLWLARLLFDDGQSGAAEEAASRAVGLLSGRGEKFLLCQCHRFLGNAIRSRGEIEKATNHLEASLALAYSFNWHHQLVWIHYSLARLFSVQRRFDEAHAHVEHAKSYAINTAAPYLLGRAIELQARVWYNQGRLKEAESETLCAAAVYERIGAAKDLEGCGELLRMIIAKTDNPASCGELDFVCEFLEIGLLPTRINLPF